MTQARPDKRSELDTTDPPTISDLGQNAKYSHGVDVFRFASDNGHAVAAPQ
jgi:hypothetical protein